MQLNQTQYGISNTLRAVPLKTHVTPIVFCNFLFSNHVNSAMHCLIQLICYDIYTTQVNVVL